MSLFASPLLFIFVLLKTAATQNDGNIVVLKCCPHGYFLQQGIPSFGTCTPAERGYSDEWAPLIYSPSRRTLSHTLPSDWIVKEGIPTCKNSVDAHPIFSPQQGNYPNFFVFDNGSILLQEYNKMWEPGSFCIESTVALVCLHDYEPEISTHNTTTTTATNKDNNSNTKNNNNANSFVQQQKVRIKKCCGDKAAYSETKGSCVFLPANISALATNIESILPPGLLGDVSTVFSIGFPECHGDDLVYPGKLGDGNASLKADGSLLFHKASATLKPGDFCVDHILEHISDHIRVFTCHAKWNEGLSGKHDMFVEDDIRFTLYPVGLILSVFFLAVTLATGCLLPGSHHVLHWRCQTAHVACLLMGDILLAITQLTGAAMPGTACTVIAVSMHFFFLSAFFWLNTMCFNIWWTFRDLRPATLDKSQEIHRLRFYGLYAWGGPLVIAGIAAIIDNLPADSSSSLVRPRFGHHRCWFYGDTEIFTYFYGPIGLLLAINLILFVATAHELTCGLWKREVVKSSTERATLGRVCLKLVIVMGLTWVADVMSWAVGGPNFIWYLTDLINALQGVFIFAVVGCQPQVWAAVNRLWCWRMQQAGTTNMGQPLSSYSQGLPSLGDSVVNSPPCKSPPLETMC